MLAEKIAGHMAAMTDKQIRAAKNRATKRKATDPVPVQPRAIATAPAAFLAQAAEREADQKIAQARATVPALTALIALFPGDCSSRRTDYQHRDEGPETRAERRAGFDPRKIVADIDAPPGERRRLVGGLYACPRISAAEGYAAALRGPTARARG